MSVRDRYNQDRLAFLALSDEPHSAMDLSRLVKMLKDLGRRLGLVEDKVFPPSPSSLRAPGRPPLSDAERLQRRHDRDRAHRKGNGDAPAA
jgi:hypothetical protein